VPTKKKKKKERKKPKMKWTHHFGPLLLVLQKHTHCYISSKRPEVTFRMTEMFQTLIMVVEA
jgi:hypothetical protein